MDQSEIDALLGDGGGSGGQPAGDAAALGAGDDGSGLLSQADIDAAMGAVGGEPAGGAAGAVAVADTRVDSAGRPFDAAAAAMAAAVEEEQRLAQQRGAQAAASLPVAEVSLPSFDQAELESAGSQPISLLNDVELHVKVELGRTLMFVEDVLRLGEGSVVELDKSAGDPVDVYVNGRLVARGEVLVLNDNFCVRVSEILGADQMKSGG